MRRRWTPVGVRAAGRIIPHHHGHHGNMLLVSIASDIFIFKNMKPSSVPLPNPGISNGKALLNRSILAMWLKSSKPKPADGRVAAGFVVAPEGTPILPAPAPKPFNIPGALTPTPKSDGLWFKVGCTCVCRCCCCCAVISEPGESVPTPPTDPLGCNPVFALGVAAPAPGLLA